MSDKITKNDSPAAISAIKDYFPILSLMGLGYGVIYQSVYYAPFNVNILAYTDFSELLLNTLNHLVIIVIPGVFLVIITTDQINKYLDRRLNNIEIEKQFEYVKKTKLGKGEIISNKINNWLLFIVFFLSMVAFMLDYLVNKRFEILSLLLIITCNSFAWIFSLYLDHFKKYYKSTFNTEIDQKLYLTIQVSILLLGVATCCGLYNSEQVKKHSTLGTYIIIGKDTIKATTKYYYIGRTNGYIFFYNELTKHTDIIDSKKVEILSTN